MTFLLVLALAVLSGAAERPPGADSQLWLRYPGKAGLTGSGKRVVLIAAEGEYRSEETMPMLARLLSERHGFDCSVLFSIDPKTGFYDPNVLNNIPGLHLLKSADLLILSVRFLELEGEQREMMKEYFQSGRPLIGLRTTTHGFRGELQSFGGGVFGSWSGHHGQHGRQATRGVLPAEESAHPVLTGVKDVFDPAGAYGVSSSTLKGLGATTLVYGQVLEGLDPASPPVQGGMDNKGNTRNDPMMPVVWTCRHTWPSGVVTPVLTSTMGCSQAFVHEGMRRILVNACYWMTGLQKSITGTLDCDFAGQYRPTPFKGHRDSEYWTQLARTPEKLRQ